MREPAMREPAMREPAIKTKKKSFFRKIFTLKKKTSKNTLPKPVPKLEPVPKTSYCEKQNDSTYEDMTEMGNLYVYNDSRPMEYISASSTEV